MRHDVTLLIGKVSSIPGIDHIAMTTNGVMLSRHAVGLKAAGLDRITVSLDSLTREKYHQFTKSDKLDQVLEGIDSLSDAGFQGTKLNTVVVRGFNEDELTDIVEFALDRGVEPRFIEYMDVGGATGWSSDKVVSRSEILTILEERFGPLQPDAVARGSAPAERFFLPDGRAIGIVASTTTPFCSTCDRARLTADGHLLLCLYTDSGADLRELVRGGCSDVELTAALRSIWEGRSDRGALDRLGADGRAPLYEVSSLRQNPLREMHTRGG